MCEQKQIALQETVVRVKSKQIGNLIRRAISEAKPIGKVKWTQLTLAKHINVDKDVLNKMINGKSHIEITYLSNIAKVLNVAFRFSIPHGEIAINLTEGVDVVIEPGKTIDDIVNI